SGCAVGRSRTADTQVAIVRNVQGMPRTMHVAIDPATDGGPMHHSRLCALLIDCRVADIGQAAEFWAAALGRAVDPDHPGTRGNYVMLETPEDEPIVQLQRVEHESRVHIDIETDDIPAEVSRLEALGAQVVDRLERWVVMQAPTGQRFCVVRVQRPGFPKNANRWD
ncbi:VOC family protein, partial [Pseudoxanthomonas helianthi]